MLIIAVTIVVVIIIIAIIINIVIDIVIKAAVVRGGFLHNIYYLLNLHMW
jgi:hypothetical protein